jgi:hypothetical protein
MFGRFLLIKEGWHPLPLCIGFDRDNVLIQPAGACRRHGAMRQISVIFVILHPLKGGAETTSV